MGSVPHIDTNLPTISREAVNRSGVPRWGAGNPSIIVRFAEAGPVIGAAPSRCPASISFECWRDAGACGARREWTVGHGSLPGNVGVVASSGPWGTR
ncbi:MAG: hypothetical protein RJB04_1904 [Verrucomicrobiota bacterium]